jgi:hypothetical protein
MGHQPVPQDQQVFGECAELGQLGDALTIGTGHSDTDRHHVLVHVDAGTAFNHNLHQILLPLAGSAEPGGLR